MKKLVFIVILLFSNITYAKKLKFFNYDLHIGVVGDVKNIFESLGHEVESKSISMQTWVFDKPKEEMKYVSQATWENLNPEMVEKFYQEYKDYLSQFDGFIVTHAASFALLYEKFNKPIIFINTTRYSNKFIDDPKRLKWLNSYLKEGVSKKKIFVVSNNKGDQHYLKYYTGIDSKHIPSLCLYTNAKYTGIKNGFIVKERIGMNLVKIFKQPELISHIKQGYKWQELYDFKGIIHFPYQISTMSLFEQYSANVPLFFPTKDFLIALHKEYPKKILSELSFYQVIRKKTPDGKDNPDNIENPEILKEWIDYADFYDQNNMPYIQYFNSFADLEYLLEHSNLKQISLKMAEYNKIRKERAILEWKEILAEVEKNL